MNIQSYTIKSKNIKFPLPIISLIVRGLYYSYIYNNFTIKEENLRQLKEDIKERFRSNDSSSDSLYSRKVVQFLKSLITQINKESLIRSNSKSNKKSKENEGNVIITKSELFETILSVILKMGADYLRLDSLIYLEKIIEMGVFKNCYTPEAAMIIYMKESYYDCKVNTEIISYDK